MLRSADHRDERCERCREAQVFFNKKNINKIEGTRTHCCSPRFENDSALIKLEEAEKNPCSLNYNGIGLIHTPCLFKYVFYV